MPNLPPEPSLAKPAFPDGGQANWPFLVIAVLMAVVLWLFVRTGAEPQDVRTLVMPVAVENAAGDFDVAPDRIELRLEASGTHLAHLSAEEAAVVADLAGHRPGDLVPLTIVPPHGFKVLSASAAQVRVVLRPSPEPR